MCLRTLVVVTERYIIKHVIFKSGAVSILSFSILLLVEQDFISSVSGQDEPNPVL